MRMRRIGAAVLACGLWGSAQAGFMEEYMTDPEDGMLDASRYLSTVPMGFLPVPTIITEPAVGNGIGLAGIFFHESEEQKAMRVRGEAAAIIPNNISMVVLAATENGSKGAGFGHVGFWRDDHIRYRGFAFYPDFNLDFYSFGGIEPRKPVELNLKGPAVVQSIKFRLGDSRWMAGVKQNYRMVDLSLQETVNLPDPEIEAAVNRFLKQHIDREITTSGAGVLAEYDTRDNPMAPQSGLYYSGEYLWYGSAIGSDVDYGRYTLQGLNYWNVNSHFNFALRLQFDGVESSDSASLPPYALPYVDLRGIPAVRYQGRAVAVAEVEATWKVTPRWRINAFTGGGRAGDTLGDLSEGEVANNVGGGFRYLIARRYGMIMGLDVARGPEDTAVYIKAGSSW